MMPLLDEGLGDGVVVKTIGEGLWNAASDWWWVWLLFAAFIVVAKIVTDCPSA
jgi:hypothetical protein